MRLIIVSLLLAMTTFTTPACADPPNAFRDAYHRGDYAEALRMVRPDDALRMVRVDAEQGDPLAQTFLGHMYFSGQGVPKNEAEGVKWYRRAAEQGEPWAQCTLADLYLRGQGVPKDEAEGVRWYRRAAEQGYASAQVLLGGLYKKGEGVPQDFAQAAIWFSRAAEQGDDTAQLTMGYLYVQGRGVPRDYVSSYMWFNLAAANPSSDTPDKPPFDLRTFIHAEAAKKRDQISRLMTVEQIAEAQRLSRNWKPVKWTKGPPASSPAVYHGTGFFVSQNGLVLTNAHVIEDCQHTSVRTGDKTFSVRVLARDASNDLALLASDLRSAPRAALRPSVRMGEEIVVYGYPLSSILASSGNITVGNVSALAGIRDDSRYLQISAPVQQGNSGGPVLDRQGNVVGIVVGKLDALAVATTTKDIPQNVNFAIKSTVIMSFLDTQKVETAEPNAGTSLSTAELAERANKFTVQVECRP